MDKETILKTEEFQQDEYEAQPRRLEPRINLSIGIIAVTLSLFQLYTSWRGSFDVFIQRPLHIAFVFTILFAIYPPRKKSGRKNKILLIDWILIASTLICTIWVMINADQFMEGISDSTLTDLVLGAIIVLLVLEGSRRVLGPVLPVIACLAIFYAIFGSYVPGIWAHRGFSIKAIIEQLYMSNIGIWGFITGISATIIPGFLIFGTLLQKTGGGETFVDLAKRIAGRSHGGPAKVSIFSSALFGTISGSAVANVVVDGIFNIPLMKSLGYKHEFAGGVEASTSTGGQLVPPIMGAGAFIMAELLGIPYSRVAIGAIIPAVLYYLCCYAGIHFEAQRLHLKPIPSDMIPSFWKEILPKSPSFILPVSILVYLLGVGYSPSLSILYSIMVSIGWNLLSSRKKETLKVHSKQIIAALEAGGKAIVMVAALCACAQIVVAMFSMTGIGVKFSEMIIAFGHGSNIWTLFFGMMICLVLGMGVPSTAAYVLAGSVVGPALISLEADPLVTHMFIFYFAILSAITPPVCTAVYVASAIAQSNWWKTGWVAVRLGIAGFIIPYMFFYAPTLLLFGEPLHIIVNSITAAAGVISVSAAVMGFFLKPISWIERLMLLLGGFMFIDPKLVTDAIGFLIIGVVYINQKCDLLAFLRRSEGKSP